MKTTPFQIAQLAAQLTSLHPLRSEPRYHLKNAIRLLYFAERELQELNTQIRDSNLKDLATALTAPTAL